MKMKEIPNGRKEDIILIIETRSFCRSPTSLKSYYKKKEILN